MRYLSFSSNQIAKKCPEGQHYHYGGMTCHDINKPHKAGTKANEWHQKHGLVTAEGETPTKEEEPKKEVETTGDETDNVPEHKEQRTIGKYERASDIDTSEAEWICSRNESKQWEELTQKGKDAQKRLDDKILDFKRKSNDGEQFTCMDVFDTLKSVDGIELEIPKDHAIGEAIWGDSKYKHAKLEDIDKHSAIAMADGVAEALESMPALIGIKMNFGAMTSNSAGGCCWPQTDGTSNVRFDVSEMNQNMVYPRDYYTVAYRVEHPEVMEKVSSSVRGEYAETTVVHELTHSYINKLVYDLLEKGQKNGGVKKEYNGSTYNYTYRCTTITCGKIPKLSRWDNTPLFNEENCDPSYVYVGRFTQQVLQDAQKIAKSMYGMDKETFREQMTIYGQTKAKEGIPEAVSDVIVNGENATLANKLIYLSLQRYARFIYSDEKEIQPIGEIIKDLKSKQKQKGEKPKAKKSISKQREYISFKELMEMVI